MCLWPDKVVISGRRIGNCRILVIRRVRCPLYQENQLRQWEIKMFSKRKTHRKMAMIVQDLSAGNVNGNLISIYVVIYIYM